MHKTLHRALEDAVRWRDVDLDVGTVTVSQQRTTASYRVVVVEPKKQSRRVIPIDAPVVDALRGHRRSALEERIFMGPAWVDSGYILVREDGEPYHPQRPRVMFEQVCTRAGIVPKRLLPRTPLEPTQSPAIAATGTREPGGCVWSTTLACVELRVVSPHDWELWRDIRLRALDDSPEAFGATLDEWKSADEDRWRRRLSAVPFNVVALVGDEAVGQASGTQLDGDQRVELISMWVAPSTRGSGVADALVTSVREYAERAGASAVRVSVRRYNERAIGMYEKAGFVLADEPGGEPAEIAMGRPVR